MCRIAAPVESEQPAGRLETPRSVREATAQIPGSAALTSDQEKFDEGRIRHFKQLV